MGGVSGLSRGYLLVVCWWCFFVNCWWWAERPYHAKKIRNSRHDCSAVLPTSRSLGILWANNGLMRTSHNTQTTTTHVPTSRTKIMRPLSSELLSCSMAWAACSGLANSTMPQPRERPPWSVMTSARMTSPPRPRMWSFKSCSYGGAGWGVTA